MQLPSALKYVVGVLPAVAAAAQSNIQILNAPGATLRYRLWGIAVTHTDVAQAPARDWWFLSSGGQLFWEQSTSGFDGTNIVWPGGIIVPTNGVVTLSAIGDLLNVARRGVLYYTIEAVS